MKDVAPTASATVRLPRRGQPRRKRHWDRSPKGESCRRSTLICQAILARPTRQSGVLGGGTSATRVGDAIRPTPAGRLLRPAASRHPRPHRPRHPLLPLPRGGTIATDDDRRHAPPLRHHAPGKRKSADAAFSRRVRVEQRTAAGTVARRVCASRKPVPLCGARASPVLRLAHRAGESVAVIRSMVRLTTHLGRRARFCARGAGGGSPPGVSARRHLTYRCPIASGTRTLCWPRTERGLAPCSGHLAGCVCRAPGGAVGGGLRAGDLATRG